LIAGVDGLVDGAGSEFSDDNLVGEMAFWRKKSAAACWSEGAAGETRHI
jgi:hypothetical protein